MRLAMHNWMRPEPLATTLERLRRCGYDALEISGEPERHAPEPTARLLAAHGIRCWGAVTIMTPGRDLVAVDPAVRASTLEYMTACGRLVHDLGGEVLAVVPSTVGKTQPGADPETEWRWAVEGLRQLAERCAAWKVRVALEPINRFETYFLNRADQALRLAADVGPGVGVALDTFHLNIEDADPVAAIRSAGDRLYDLHIADTNRGTPGQGHFPWAATIDALRAMGYQGCLTAEFVLPVDRSPLGARFHGPAAAAAAPEAAAAGPAEDIQFIRDHGSDVLGEEEYGAAVGATSAFLRSLLGGGGR